MMEETSWLGDASLRSFRRWWIFKCITKFPKLLVWPRLQIRGDAMEHSKRAIQMRCAKDTIAKAVLAARMCYDFIWTIYRYDPQAQEGCFHQFSIPRVHTLFSQALQRFYGCSQSFYVLFSGTVFVSTLDLAADIWSDDKLMWKTTF